MAQTPTNAVEYIFYEALTDQADVKLFKSTPTLHADDFQISKNGGAYAPLNTTPTNTPGGVSVKITLSATEMTADNVVIACSDAVGAEWSDKFINIQPQAVGVTLADGAHGGTAAVLTLKQLAVSNPDAGAPAVSITGAGTGNSHGINVLSTNAKALALTSTNSDAVSVDASSGDAIVIGDDIVYQAVELSTIPVDVGTWLTVAVTASANDVPDVNIKELNDVPVVGDGVTPKFGV